MDYKQEQFLRMQQYQYAPKMPFYMSYPIQNIYMTEMEYERDMERIKELYPDEAKQIQMLVEEECDKMEYEGSLMFDEYPDRLMLKIICDRIYQNATNQTQVDTDAAAQQLSKEQDSEDGQDADSQLEQQNIRHRPGRPPGRPPGPWGPPPPPPGRPPGPWGPPPPPPGRPPGPWGPPPPPGRPPHNAGLGTLIEVLLYNEMYKRRCRHNRCRRWW